jgi:transposase
MLWSIGTAGHCLSSHAPQIQDRDGDRALLQISGGLFPSIGKVWADGGYKHDRVTQATSITVAILSKIAGQSGFVVLPRRWVVEGFFAWINRNRRLAKDVKAIPTSPHCRRKWRRMIRRNMPKARRIHGIGSRRPRVAVANASPLPHGASSSPAHAAVLAPLCKPSGNPR